MMPQMIQMMLNAALSRSVQSFCHEVGLPTPPSPPAWLLAGLPAPPKPPLPIPPKPPMPPVDWLYR